MKFLSLIIIVLALMLTWHSYKKTSEVSAGTHFLLQNELKTFIADYISKNVEGSSNIRFQKFWTEPTDTKSVRAMFEYAFDVTDANQEVTTSVLTGTAQLSPTDKATSWSLDKVEINNNVIEFQNGSVVEPEK